MNPYKLPVYLLMSLLLISPALASGYLEVSKTEGCSGAVGADIRLFSNSASIDSFQLTFTYDPLKLTLTGCTGGSLTSSWDTISCADVSGTIYLDGTTGAGDAIGINSLGTLLTLNFDIMSGLTEDDTSPLTLSNPLLDIAGYNLISSSFTASCPDGTISLNDLTGCYMDDVSFAVSIGSNVNFIDQFGFIVQFDPAVMVLETHCSSGDLTTDWEVISCNPIEGSPGEVLVVGSNEYDGNRISPMSSGSIVMLDFEIICQDCPESTVYPVSIHTVNESSMPFNDLSGYVVDNGEFTYGCPPPPVDVVVEDSTGVQAEVIEVEVDFTDLPGTVDDFGFQVHYPTAMLEYSHFAPGSLTSGWIGPNGVLDCYEDSAGLLKVGAYNPDPIYLGTSGSVIKLYFTVNCPGCIEGQTGDLILDHLVDDVDGWGAQSGIFTFITVHPPTPTPPPLPAESGAGIAMMLVMITLLALGVIRPGRNAARHDSTGTKGGQI